MSLIVLAEEASAGAQADAHAALSSVAGELPAIWDGLYFLATSPGLGSSLVQRVRKAPGLGKAETDSSPMRLVIYDCPEDQVYVHSGPAVDAAAIRDFVQAFGAGKLEGSYISDE